MTATRSQQRVLVAALILSLVGLAVMVGDKITHADIANRETFDLLQLVFAVLALVLGVAVIVKARRTVIAPEPVIDLRERLSGLVDLDDTITDRAMNPGTPRT